MRSHRRPNTCSCDSNTYNSPRHSRYTARRNFGSTPHYNSRTQTTPNRPCDTVRRTDIPADMHDIQYYYTRRMVDCCRANSCCDMPHHGRSGSFRSDNRSFYICYIWNGRRASSYRDKSCYSRGTVARMTSSRPLYRGHTRHERPASNCCEMFCCRQGNLPKTHCNQSCRTDDTPRVCPASKFCDTTHYRLDTLVIIRRN
jgi:hypothetical protein